MRKIYGWIILISILLTACAEEPHLVIVADDANGVKEGDFVEMMGVRIGRVESFGFVEDMVAINVKLDEEIKLPTNAYAFLKLNVFSEGNLNILPSDTVMKENPYGQDTIIMCRPKYNLKYIEEKIDSIIENLDSNQIKFKDIQIDFKLDSDYNTFTIKVDKKKLMDQ
ncbi:MAG: MCE family protein [Flavobacteriales bacterium]|nr:MCE family protein [Flavobacteriales bacterium]MCB9198420.1 MCE family protein [Flavobacteriales bacterium]